MRNRATTPLKRPKFRMSMSKYNLYNLSQLTAPPYRQRTFFQQKWKAKSVLRQYHGEQVSEGQWEKMFSRRLRAVVPMNPVYLAQNDGSAESAGRGSGKELLEPHRAPDMTPYMNMTFAPLERRLDVAIFRALFASSARQARQFVIHGNVKVNGQVMRYSGYLLNPGDMFQVDPECVMFAMGQPKAKLSKEAKEKKAEREQSSREAKEKREAKAQSESAEVQEELWLCRTEQCGTMNSPKLSKCSRCHAFSPEKLAKSRPFQEGDWRCSKDGCSHHNDSIRTYCVRCGTPSPKEGVKPLSLRKGDWRCAASECSYQNSAKLSSCRRCNAPRPGVALPPEGSTAPKKAKSGQKPKKAVEEAEAVEAVKDCEETKEILANLQLQARSLLSSPQEGMGGKQKQDLRAFKSTVRKMMSRAGKGTVLTDSLEAQFETLKHQLNIRREAKGRGKSLGPSQQIGGSAGQNPEATTQDNKNPTTNPTDTESGINYLSEYEENELFDALKSLQDNPIDSRKPYHTPWLPRNYMSAFAFIPRYLEVNQNICAAVYLRHPVARPGMAEVPTPYSEQTNSIAFAWYLRRR